MWNGMVVGLCAVLLSAATSFAADAEKKNFATNPSMEIAATDESLAKDWHDGELTPQVLDELDSKVARTGKNSLHMKFKAAEKPVAARPFFYTMGFEPLEGGKTYTLTAWVKGSEFKGTVLMLVSQYPAPFPSEAIAMSPEVTLDTPEWKQLKFSFKTRQDIAALQVRLIASCPANLWGGELWFDDVAVVEGEQP